MALTSRKFAYPDGWDNPASDFYGKGNYGKPDRPGYTTEDMQKVLDEISRTIIAPRINQIIDDLVAYIDGASGADNIGATPVRPGGANTVQGILDDIAQNNSSVITGRTVTDEVAPQGATPEQLKITIPSSYAIVDYVQDLGGGDMSQSMYDPRGIHNDAFKAQYSTITDTNNFYTSTNVDGALDELAQKNWYNITISTSNPTGGSNGDIWIKVT